MKTVFVPNEQNETIDANKTFAIKDEINGSWRLAKTQLNEVSNSGKTIKPMFIEKGARLIYHHASIALEDEQDLVVYFTGHGTDPKSIVELPKQDLIEDNKNWEDFRNGIRATPGIHEFGRRRNATYHKKITQSELLKILEVKRACSEVISLELIDLPDGDVAWLFCFSGAVKDQWYLGYGERDVIPKSFQHSSGDKPVIPALEIEEDE